MLTLESLREFTKKFQTHEKNVVREYVQHLFLSHLYKNKGSEKLLFKGGTSLRLIFQSPRFSEDLDFTGVHISRLPEIEDVFLRALSDIEKIGIEIGFKEAKATTGGYLGLIHYALFDFREDMKFEISLRRNAGASGEFTTIASDFTVAYSLMHLKTETLVKEKISALLDRKKARDYYDLYFMLRHPGLKKFIDKTKMKNVAALLAKEQLNFKAELSVLLPVSHHMILKNFKTVLQREVAQYL